MNELKKPILIFKGSTDECYGILRAFSDRLRDALASLGEEVIYLETDEDFITGYTNRDYKAVIAFMDTVFNNFYPGTQTPLFDLYHGPKFNYWPDHPSVFLYQMDKTPKDYYILTQDRNYVDFINRYYDKVRSAFFLPPGGWCDEAFVPKPLSDRKIDVSFVGTYKDWRKTLEASSFDGADGEAFRDTYLDTLITKNSLTTEDALRLTIEQLGISLNEDGYLNLLNNVSFLASTVVTGLFREKVLGTILDGGISVDVFGASWNSSPFSNNPHLHIHDSKDAADISDIYAESKISLNVMTWHKNCITERVLDSMCAGSIALTDRTEALSKKFVSEKEILYYSLSELNIIPELIRKHINDDTIAQNGRGLVMKSHLWINRAKELLQIIESVEN